MTSRPLRWRDGRPLAVTLGTALLAGCSVPVQQVTPAPPRPNITDVSFDGRPVREGGDLVMALSAEPDELDPTTSSSLYSRYVFGSMCEKLYDIDADGGLVPQLATALPTLEDGGRRVVIPVRTDARFADGTPMDAAAVVTTLKRNLTLEDSSRKKELGPVTGVRAQGKDKVVLTYAEPFAPLTSALADRAGMILSPTALEKAGDTFGQRPVCVGPFKFAARIPQTSIQVVRDPFYYAAKQIHLDSITYRIMADANIRAANLRSGDVQVADTISTQDADALTKEKGVGLLQTGSLGYQGLTLNLGNTEGAGKPPGRIDTPLASDPRVRRALAMSIDRTVLVNAVFNNWYDAACSFVAPDSPFSTKAGQECTPYDPAGAKALLAEAGVKTPYKITLSTSNTAESLRFAQALQASAAAGGFALKIAPVEYSTLLDVQKRGDFELLALGWSGRIDPHNNSANFLSTGAGNNYSGYSSPKADALLTQAAQATDVKKRGELYGRVMEQVRADNPIIYVYRIRSLTGHTKDVAGVQVYADAVVRLSRAAFLAQETS